MVMKQINENIVNEKKYIGENGGTENVVAK